MDEPLAVGIDLGTTYSAIAFLDDSGRPQTVRNRSGDLLTASALLFSEDEILVGKDAIRQSVQFPEAYADSFKRDMGLRSFRHTVRDFDVPPEVLSGILLQRMIRDAEGQVGKIAKAVITVPAFFDETRRRATQRAGQLADIDVIDIINEPTAAALAYGSQQGFLNLYAPSKGEADRVLVYDLGGGTFDVTVLEVDGKNFRTLATDGDVKLGGRDFDELLVNYFADDFCKRHGIDLRAEPASCASLWIDAQLAKHALSVRQRAEVTLEHEGNRLRIDVTRSEFEELIGALIGRTEITTKMVMQDANLTSADIDRVLLVGGSTRIPMVEDMLRKVFGDKLDRSLSPDEAVAHGAALYAGIIQSPETKAFDLTNVNSHSLGVVGRDPKTQRRVVSVLIPKNSALPCTIRKQFQTARDGQESVAVTVVEGESHSPDNCTPLGKCVVRDLPPDIPAATPVFVEFQYLANGLLSVSAQLPEARRSAHAEISTDRQEVNENLEMWRSRLLNAGDDKDATIDSLESTSMEGALVELDNLYKSIGAASVTQDLPWLLSRTKKAAAEALDTLAGLRDDVGQAEIEHEKAITQADKVHTLSTLSRCKSELAKHEELTNLSLIELGRRCVGRSCPLSGVEDKVVEARKLRERIELNDVG